MIEVLSGDLGRIHHQKQIIKKEFLARANPLGLLEINLNRDWQLDEFLMNLKTNSFLSPQKLIFLYNLKTNPVFKDQIQAIITSVAQTELVNLVIIEPNLDLRSRLGQFLKKLPGFKQFTPFSNQELVGVLVKKSQILGSNLDHQTAQYIIENKSSDLFELESELSKLRVFSKINQKIVDQFVPTSIATSTFLLLEAVIRGKLGPSLRLYQQQRQQKNQPLQIFSLLIWQLQVLLITFLGSKGQISVDQLAQDFKIHSFPLKKAVNLSSDLKQSQLQELVNCFQSTERLIKVDFVDPDKAVFFLIARCCQIIKPKI